MFDQAKKRVTGDTEMEWYERIASLAYDWQSRFVHFVLDSHETLVKLTRAGFDLHRDWLLTSRMLVSDSFSRFIPDASRYVAFQLAFVQFVVDASC